ncbi:MAG: hypothetical protein PWP31_573 [Clostridia bacterium]|nr:hypothetical protein [Clostridia bacterium]
MFGWGRCHKNLQQQLTIELERCNGKLGGRLQKRLKQLEVIDLAKLLNGVWSLLDSGTKEQLIIMVNEEGLVDKWLLYLQQGNVEEKVVAATILGNLQETRALGFLLEAIRDRDEGVQLAATEALIKLRDPRCLKLLITGLNEPKRLPPARIADVLLAFGTTSIPPLLHFLEESPEEVTVRIIEILGLFKDSQTLTALENCLRTGSDNVREAAANVLGEMEVKEVGEILIIALKDNVPRVRAAAVRALGKLKHKEAQPALTACLDDDSQEVRLAAKMALKVLAVKNSF